MMPGGHIEESSQNLLKLTASAYDTSRNLNSTGKMAPSEFKNLNTGATSSLLQQVGPA